MVRLILARGLPGVGKSTFAEAMVGFKVTSTDDYFSRTGTYIFAPQEYKQAHDFCLDETRSHLRRGQNVIVANTFSRRWEMQPYLMLAQELRQAGAKVMLTVIDLYDAGLTDEQLAEFNTHQVPIHTIQNMRARWEHDWKNGSPEGPGSAER